MTLRIRSAVAADAALIIRFIADLAAYEQLSHEAKATEADIVRDLFGADPKVFCEIAEWDGRPVGFGLWFYTYSTFQGRYGIWLEDLFVEPEHRGSGLGRELLATLARTCVERGYRRLEWWVLDWNEPSIGFYRSLGAVPQDEWTVFRMDGDELAAMGS